MQILFKKGLFLLKILPISKVKAAALQNKRRPEKKPHDGKRTFEEVKVFDEYTFDNEVEEESDEGSESGDSEPDTLDIEISTSRDKSILTVLDSIAGFTIVFQTNQSCFFFKNFCFCKYQVLRIHLTTKQKQRDMQVTSERQFKLSKLWLWMHTVLYLCLTRKALLLEMHASCA